MKLALPPHLLPVEARPTSHGDTRSGDTVETDNRSRLVEDKTWFVGSRAPKTVVPPNTWIGDVAEGTDLVPVLRSARLLRLI
jgi:hypothetical protein